VSVPTTISLSHPDSVFKGKFLLFLVKINVFFLTFMFFTVLDMRIKWILYRSGFSHSKAELPASHLFVCTPLLVCLLYYYVNV